MTGTRHAARADPRPLIAHVVFRFDYGGLENGVVNLINRMPDEAFRHCVIALTEATGFQARIRKPDVAVHCIGKQPGKDPAYYLRLYRLLKALKPAIVHTRNLPTLECLFVAWLAGTPVRIHGEHGWDVYDPDGTSRRYRLLRRLLAPLIHRFVTVSNDLAEWLAGLGIPKSRIRHICNGVDTERFRPRSGDHGEALPGDAALPGGVFPPGSIVVGSVTRFSAIKDPLNLVEAFITLRRNGGGTERARLLMLGDGELCETARVRLEEAGLSAEAWLPGSRDDVPELLRAMHVFVLGSLREGISNTILEAMASGLPVVATDTGGNGELVEEGVTGALVPPADPGALATALRGYVNDAEKRQQHGRKARERACNLFSLAAMVDGYRRLYEDALEGARA
jgi:sugar transferase (PEP-CTERM/EpsH1 system associated)